MKYFIFAAIIMLSKVAVASDLEHPIQINSVKGITVVSKENVPTTIAIERVTLYLTISSVTMHNSNYFISYNCQSKKLDSDGKVVGLSNGEQDIVSIFERERIKVDCGFQIQLELSLANKLINKDKKQLAVFVPQHFSQQFFAYY